MQLIAFTGDGTPDWNTTNQIRNAISQQTLTQETRAFDLSDLGGGNGLTPVANPTVALEAGGTGRVAAPVITRNDGGTPYTQTVSANQGPSNIEMIGGSVARGIAAAAGAYTQARAQSRSYASQAQNYRAKAAQAALNYQAAKRSIYDVAQNHEYEAMLTGLQNAQTIGRTRARVASSGVRLGQGSAAEVEATQRMNARRDWITGERNRTAAMNVARTQASNARTEELIALGNAEAARIMGQSVSPWTQAAGAFIHSYGLADMSWAQTYGASPTLSFF